MVFESIEDRQFLKTGATTHALYGCILLLVITLLAALPFIQTDVTVKASGIVRPQNERTDIRSIQGGIIDSMYVKEGQQVTANTLMLKIRDGLSPGKRIHNHFEITQRQHFIHDLELLTKAVPGERLSEQLLSAVYIAQLSHFLRQKSEQDILLQKADKEVELNTSLARDKVISPKEFFDIRHNQEKIQAGIRVLIQGQLSVWQQDLSRYRMERSQLDQQQAEVNTQAGYYEVRAPVAGTIQGIAPRYPGGILQASETICSISPEGSLTGECFVSSKDMGLLHTGQQVRYQVDAFDYKYFGVLTGKIIRIDNDFTPIDNKPFFKVHCSFDSNRLHLKNGYTGQLKKGLEFQAGFTVARRSLWQLLFDRMDDWLNPHAPQQTLSYRL